MWFKSSFVFMIYYSAIVMVGINDLSTTAVLFFYRLHYTVRLNLLLEYTCHHLGTQCFNMLL